jgi:hypothetical protein
VRRREFITLIGSAAVAWPLAVRAQQAALPVIGFLNSRAPGENPAILAAFRRGLKEAGYVEGQDVTVEYRWADGQYDRLPALAADLVGRRVAAIVANGPAVQTAKSATSTLPIVFVAGFDPLAFGLVASLNRPGGNLTGVSVLGDRGEAAKVAARVGPHGDYNCFTRQPDDSRCRNRNERRAGSCPRPRDATPCPACEQRGRFRFSLCNGGPTAGRRPRDRRRSIFHKPEPTARQVGSRSRGACDLRVSRVRCGRRPDKLRNQHCRRIPFWLASTPAVSSKVKSLPSCRCSRRRKLSCTSISRPRRCSVSLFRCRYSAAPTR